MPRATDHPTPSRRGLLSAAALLPLAVLPALPAIVAATPIDDPLLHLYRQYIATQTAEALACDHAEAIRRRIAARSGRPSADRPVSAIWAHDPDYAALGAAIAECDEITNHLCDITDLMVETPATTPAGVAVKLLIAIDVFPKPNDNTEYHERVAIAVMMDAVAALPSHVEAV